MGVFTNGYLCSVILIFISDYHVYSINHCGAGLSVIECRLAATVKDLETIKKALNYKKYSFARHSTVGMLTLK